jgi:hypothetical protein
MNGAKTSEFRLTLSVLVTMLVVLVAATYYKQWSVVIAAMAVKAVAVAGYSISRGIAKQAADTLIGRILTLFGANIMSDANPIVSSGESLVANFATPLVNAQIDALLKAQPWISATTGQAIVTFADAGVAAAVGLLGDLLVAKAPGVLATAAKL